MNIGSVRADNIEDPTSLESIRHGFIKGEGLLGEIVVAVHGLANAVHDDEPYSCSRYGPAWLNLYRVLKAIEKRTNEQLTFICAHCGAVANVSLCRVGILDSGTSLICDNCGQDTVVDLDTPEDRAAWYRLVERANKEAVE